MDTTATQRNGKVPAYLMVCMAVLVMGTLMSGRALAGDSTRVPVSQIFLGELRMLESEFVPLAEAMPAGQYGFAPATGEFKGVRTFGLQVSHAAHLLYVASASILGENLPPEAGTDDNGPATLKSREEILQYLKSAFAYAKKAMGGLSETNLTEPVKVPWGTSTRLFLADMMLWHSFDHYGQMVEYVRMNGIIPPASRPREASNTK